MRKVGTLPVCLMDFIPVGMLEKFKEVWLRSLSPLTVIPGELSLFVKETLAMNML